MPSELRGPSKTTHSAYRCSFVSRQRTLSSTTTISFYTDTLQRKSPLCTPSFQPSFKFSSHTDTTPSYFYNQYPMFSLLGPVNVKFIFTHCSLSFNSPVVYIRTTCVNKHQLSTLYLCLYDNSQCLHRLIS